jgi:hypothetical protein
MYRAGWILFCKLVRQFFCAAFFIEAVNPPSAGRTGNFVLFLENDAKYLIFAAFPKSSMALFVS